MSTVYAGVDNNFTTSITIPSDGDADAAASVNVAFQALEDDTVFLKNRIGQYQLFAMTATSLTASLPISWNTGAYANQLVLGATIHNVKNGDIVEIVLNCSPSIQGNVTDTARLALHDSVNGGAVTLISDAQFIYTVAAGTGATDTWGVSIGTTRVIAGMPGAGGDYFAAVMGRQTSGTPTLSLLLGATAFVKIWRAN